MVSKKVSKHLTSNKRVEALSNREIKKYVARGDFEIGSDERAISRNNKKTSENNLKASENAVTERKLALAGLMLTVGIGLYTRSGASSQTTTIQNIDNHTEINVTYIVPDGGSKTATSSATATEEVSGVTGTEDGVNSVYLKK